MTTRTIFSRVTLLLAVLAVTLVTPVRALAHCDGLDGPVVKAAEQALEKRDPAFVLVWVQPKDEPEVLKAFVDTLAVRVLSAEAKALADRFFFETVVRVHRTGEGALFTGLKPAGRDLGPAIPAADRSLQQGSVEPVIALLTRTVQQSVREHFDAAVSARTFKAGDVTAGREYVRAYVEFIHYVERLYEAATTAAHGHFEETEPAGHRR